MRVNRFTIGIAVGAVCVIAILALVLTGRGGDANVVSGSAVADAAAATERVPGANASMQMTFDIAGLAKPLELTLDGVQDFTGENGHFAGELRNMPKGALGPGSASTVPIAAIGLGNVMYIKSPLFTADLPGGKKWVKSNAAVDAGKVGFGNPADFASNDPRKFLAFLHATSDRVERVGSEHVRGVSTTHYRASVEFRNYLDALPVTDREKARHFIEAFIKATGASSFPMEVWVDDHHLVRRISFTMKIKDSSIPTPMTIHMTIELFDFGPKRAPKAPPADETIDEAKLPVGP
jgi:hypothetical protein